MSLVGLPLGSPFYTGASTNVDERWDVSIGGHGYMIDDKYLDDFGRQTIGMIRQQADTANKPGEASLNPAGLWRRALESWHLGAGQTWFDRPESLPYRFASSKGVDPWTRYALSLLPGTASIGASANTNLALAVSGGRLYYADGTGVKVTGIGDTTFAAAAGVPAQTVSSLASAGSTVYAGFLAGTTGIWQASGTVFSQLVTAGNFPLVRHVMGRLLGFGANGDLYNIVSSTPAVPPTALFTHPLGAAWTWTDATEGQSFIYASGYAGDRSLIYRIGLGTDATALDVPIVAAPLPDGELATSLQGYLGYVIIGTNKGVRFAAPQQDGSLVLGSLIPTPNPVLCSEGQDRFVWFGWTNYDATSTGLGRLDLRNFTDEVTPAYASDLMATAQGTVQSVVTYAGKRVFSVSGVGIFQETVTKVTSGTFSSGRISFGLPDNKSAVSIEVRHDALPAAAEVDLYLGVDGAAAAFVGRSELDGSSVSPADAFTLNQAVGTFFEITGTLLGDLTLRRVTMEIDPSSTRTVIYRVPLRLFAEQTLPGAVPSPMDVQAEFAYLMELLNTRRVVNFQEANDTYRVVLDDFTWKPEERREDFWNGCFIARLKGL